MNRKIRIKSSKKVIFEKAKNGVVIIIKEDKIIKEKIEKDKIIQNHFMINLLIRLLPILVIKLFHFLIQTRP